MFSAASTFFKLRYKRLIVLALFSTFFFGTLFLLSYVVNPEQTIRNFIGQTGFIFNVLTFVVESVITHYILIFEVILPAMRKERSWLKVLLVATLLFLVKFAVNYGSFLLERRSQEHSSSVSSDPSLPEGSMGWLLLISYFFVLVVSFSAALLVEWVHKDKERIILEKQKTEAELSALKHQINPHFLFNSLSFIYGKVFKVDKETADSVLMLANIMRYALGKNTALDGKVNLMDELENMKNVVEINQRRHNHGLNITYKEQIDDQSITILPLVLITLVENAFKHGDLHDPTYPLQIRVNTSVNELTFEIINKKGKGIKELSNGVGLQNISQQLKLTYTESCTFLVEEKDIHFRVFLNINFQV